MDSEAPIGIFDSGFGGLTVARAVIDQLPYEDIVYLGDTARSPYGEQPISQVREYALECLDHLLDQGVKALVIACNSASAAVLRDARERYPVPVVEVILPAARRAVAATRSGRVGVICTEATATSQAYDDAFAAAPQMQLHTAACPRFVSFVEAGITGGPELLAVAQAYLAPLQAADIDTLILGCTHYPLLTGVISYVLGDQVSLVSSAEECAKQVFAVLTRHGLTHDRPRHAQPPVPDHRQPGGLRGHRRPADGRPGGRRRAVRAARGSQGGRPPGGTVKLTVVGCSGSVSGPESPASSYLVQAPYAGGTFSLVLDLGPGAFGALYRYLNPAEVDAFALSHLHPDHCLDLCGYYVAAAYSPTAPWPRRLLFGPAGTPERLARAYDVPRNNGSPAEPGPGIATTSTSGPGSRGSRSGRSRSRPRWSTTRSRRTRCGSPRTSPAAERWSTPATPGPCDALVELARGRGPAAGRGRVAGAAGQPARAASDRPAGRRGRAARRASAPWC